MKKEISGLFINTLISCLACYSAYTGNIFVTNIFTAVTIFALSMISMMILATIFLSDDPNVKAMLQRIAKKRPFWFQTIDRISDVVMVVMLIGFGHWWKGLAWVIIHFIATSYIRGVAKISNNVLQPTQEGAEQNCTE